MRETLLSDEIAPPPATPLLHIDIVTETYPPEINGVAHTISMLVRGLRKNLHHIFVVRPEQKSDLNDAANRLSLNQTKADFLLPSVPIPFYEELRMGLPSKNKLIKRWKAKRPDLVHIATEGPLGWSAVRAARALNIPTTSDFRTNFHAYSAMYNIGFLKPLIQAYLRWIHNATQRTMVPTSMLKQELSQMGIINLEVMPRGVDTAHFSPSLRSHTLRQSWGVKENEVVLLYVGRLAVEKNLDLLIRSFYLTQATIPDIKLIIVGDGPLRHDLEKKCPHAIFTGSQRGVALAQHYASADIFVFPSLTETFGNVTIEAMASGLAVVAYRHAAAGELILDSLNGRVVDPGNEDAFIQAVTALAQHPPTIQTVGEAAVLTAYRHSWESIVKQTEQVFYHVIHAHKKITK